VGLVGRGRRYIMRSNGRARGVGKGLKRRMVEKWGARLFETKRLRAGRVLRVVAGYKSLSPAESKARKEPAVCGQKSNKANFLKITN
jgi:hypothetical protein